MSRPSDPALGHVAAAGNRRNFPEIVGAATRSHPKAPIIITISDYSEWQRQSRWRSPRMANQEIL